MVGRCRANSAHVKQSWPDFGPGFQEKATATFYGVPSSLGSGAVQGYLAHEKPRHLGTLQ